MQVMVVLIAYVKGRDATLLYNSKVIFKLIDY